MGILGASSSPFDASLQTLSAGDAVPGARETIADRRITLTYEVFKRLLDLAGASIATVLLAIPLAVAAIAIKLSSPGPVFYGQIRCGKDGTVFRCWKLRTMVADADQYLTDRPGLRDAFEQNWKFRTDPRVTPLGAILRKTSFDEIPQLLNVMRGEMSLVGPRPVVPTELLIMYGSDAPLLLSVRPGLTGLWQVCGRSTLSYGERVRLDLKYVQERSFYLDFQIFLRTPAAVIRTRGAV